MRVFTMLAAAILALVFVPMGTIQLLAGGHPNPFWMFLYALIAFISGAVLNTTAASRHDSRGHPPAAVVGLVAQAGERWRGLTQDLLNDLLARVPVTPELVLRFRLVAQADAGFVRALAMLQQEEMNVAATTGIPIGT